MTNLDLTHYELNPAGFA